MSGLAIIRAIQSIHSPGLDAFFCTLTSLNNETVYLVLVSLVMWLYDKRLARYMATLLLLGRWMNNLLKWNLNTSRPSSNDVRVLCTETAPDPAFPSGHAQMSLMFLGSFALYVRKTPVTMLIGIFVFLVGLSRLYLGLHWPLDVLGGWAIGALLLDGFDRTRGFWLGDGQSLKQRLFWAAAVPALTLLVSWLTPAGIAVENWKLAGAYLGFFAGAALEDHFVGFDPRVGNWVAQVAKVPLGLLLMAAVKVGLAPILPPSAVSDLIHYGLVTLTGTFIAPWLFNRFVATPKVGRTTTR